MRAFESVRVLIAHEDPVVAAGLVATLARCAEFQICTGGARERGPVLAPQLLDIVVTDYRRGCGLALARRQRASLGRVPKVVIVTPRDREWEVRSAVEAGVHGYLLMRCELDELIHAVRAVAHGSRYVCGSVAQRIAHSLSYERLTSRESEVLELIADGCCNKTIAARLAISVGTVKAHVKAILEKLNAASRTHAAAVAAQRGLLGARSSASAS
jgi:DNA-binding NarL/FixJ family response regulator